MTRQVPRVLAAFAALLVALIGAFAWALVGAQGKTREDIRARFAGRAQLSAALTDGLFATSATASGARYVKDFSGTVSTAVLRRYAVRNRTVAMTVLDARGTVLGTSLPAAGRAFSPPNPTGYLAGALRGARYGLSDLVHAAGLPPVLQFAIPFRTPDGRVRVMVNSISPFVFDAFFGQYLHSVPSTGGQAFIVDSRGEIIGAATRTGRGASLSPGVLRELSGHRVGSIGHTDFASHAIGATGLRIVLTAPTAVLYASLGGARGVLPWIIVFAFALAAGGALVLLRRSTAQAAALRASEERHALVVHGANDGIWDRDFATGESYVSPRWREILGIDLDEPTPGDLWMSRVHPDDREGALSSWRAHLAGRTPSYESEHRALHADGRYRWVLVRGAALRDGNGGAVRAAGSMTDVTARKLAEQKLREDALHDDLTGLANRNLFLDRLAVALRRADRAPSRRCAVLFLDLDRFKLINDSFSHTVGDELLVSIGHRLTMLLRPGDTVARGEPTDTVARLGGDEFTLLLDDIQDDEAPIAVAQRILHAFEEPFDLGDRQLHVAASIGIAVSERGMTAPQMMRNADLAMYAAKRDGRNRAWVYNDELHEEVTDRLDLEVELRRAIEERRMRVFYQPIIDLESGKLAGFEALARWPEDLPVVTPDAFIPVAEETGLIASLGRLVLETACHDLAAWRAQALVGDDVTMSVNVSAGQLGDPDRLINDVHAALGSAGLEARLLRLELTESTLISDEGRMRRTLEELSRAGVGAHVDDFGTGYSSLVLLQHFPGDALKIDRRFICWMHEDDGHHEIVRAIVSLAHNLGLQTVAEGIDHPAQLGLLRALGCTRGQGFLFSQPVAAAGIPALIARWAEVEATALRV